MVFHEVCGSNLALVAHHDGKSLNRQTVSGSSAEKAAEEFRKRTTKELVSTEILLPTGNKTHIFSSKLELLL